MNQSVTLENIIDQMILSPIDYPSLLGILQNNNLNNLGQLLVRFMLKNNSLSFNSLINPIQVPNIVFQENSKKSIDKLKELESKLEGNFETNKVKICSDCGNTGTINIGGKCRCQLCFLKYLSNKAKVDTQPVTSLVEKTPEPVLVPVKNKIRVLVTGFWGDSKTICNQWNRMSKDGDYCWDNIQIVWERPYDYIVVINKPHTKKIPFLPEKTLIFHMEPNVPLRPDIWGQWSDPRKMGYKYVFDHKTAYNNNEWHLSLNYNQLMTHSIIKSEEKERTLSTVLSGKYSDIGQIKRVDFAKFLDSKTDESFKFDIFGDNRWEYKNYRGILPPTCKDNGLVPYRYTFNAENNSITNYYTEKLIDSILSECLIFYWGAPNIKDLIDPDCYVLLPLSNFEEDFKIIKQAIDEDWWSQRIEKIRAEKKRILNELQFFPRIDRFITELENV